jgi:hypothetical protein
MKKEKEKEKTRITYKSMSKKKIGETWKWQKENFNGNSLHHIFCCFRVTQTGKRKRKKRKRKIV